jgi:hypothetical protein
MSGICLVCTSFFSFNPLPIWLIVNRYLPFGETVRSTIFQLWSEFRTLPFLRFESTQKAQNSALNVPHKLKFRQSHECFPLAADSIATAVTMI